MIIIGVLTILWGAVGGFDFLTESVQNLFVEYVKQNSFQNMDLIANKFQSPESIKIIANEFIELNQHLDFVKEDIKGEKMVDVLQNYILINHFIDETNNMTSDNLLENSVCKNMIKHVNIKYPNYNFIKNK